MGPANHAWPCRRNKGFDRRSVRVDVCRRKCSNGAAKGGARSGRDALFVAGAPFALTLHGFTA